MQLEKIISKIKRSFLNIVLVISLAFGASAKASDYSVSQVINESKIEHRLYYKQHHFMTIIDDSGTFNIRPHPGLDRNGWGSSWYMQPFLPSANLKHTTIGNIVPDDNDIDVVASGFVSSGSNDTYGTWDTNLSFRYDPENKIVNGSGNYVINLSGNLSPSTGDLNLYKISSNYLINVPLLTGGFGDTGDMKQADVIGKFNFTWNPPEDPSCFPQDITDYLSIDVIGQLNNVDSAAQGYQPIKPAYKPSMKVALSNSDPNHHGIDMIFGAIYDTSQSQYYWEDNVGITPLILNRSSLIHYSFDITFDSRALPGDASGDIKVTKCTVTAGSKDNSDAISFSGTMDTTADDISATSSIEITVDSDDMVNPCVQSFPINETTFKKGKYKCSKTENSSKTSFTFDTKTTKFSFTAKNVDLSGLGCPLTIEIEIGDYIAETEVDEVIVNGPKKPIPIKLMMGVKNALRVDSYKVTRGKKKPNTDQLSVKGGFAVEDTGVNLAAVDFVVGLAGQTFTIPAGSFTAKNGVFTCKNVKLSGGEIANTSFNLNTCSFTLTIKNTTITAGSGAANFSVEFADFSESVPIVLP